MPRRDVRPRRGWPLRAAWVQAACAGVALAVIACRSAAPDPTPTPRPADTATPTRLPSTPSPAPAASPSPNAATTSTAEAAMVATFEAYLYGRGAASTATTTTAALPPPTATPPSATAAAPPATAPPVAPPPPKPGGTATRAPTATTPPSAPPTLAQLRRAMLTTDDLGRQWVEFDSGDVKQSHPAVYGDFDSDADEYLSIELHDARNGVPDFIAVGLLVGESFQGLAQASPPPYGADGVRYRYQLEQNGKRRYGELVGWRHKGVVAGVRFESTKPDACVCDYGKRQQDKLAATIP